MDVETIHQTITAHFRDGVRVSPIEGGEYLIVLPLWDNMGDPVHLSVGFTDDEVTFDDAGSIVGLLFSLGQHVEGTPAFGLLEDLVRSHGLELDYIDGLVRVSVPHTSFYEGLAEILKIVLALQTVVPHIRKRPARPRSFGGPRLKSKLRDDCRRVGILDRVQGRTLDGAVVRGWPIDFHWSTNGGPAPREVDVITADLNVVEPFPKAQRITTFSVDTRQVHGHDELRVVIEAPAENNSAMEAKHFLRHYSAELGYKVFDYSDQRERLAFIRAAVDEVSGNGHGHSEDSRIAHLFPEGAGPDPLAASLGLET